MNNVQQPQKDEEAAPVVSTRPVRDPFARMRATDVYWIQLKPVFKGKQITQPERLARVTAYQDRAAHLEMYRLQVQLDEEPLAEDANHMDVLIDHRNRRVRFAPASTLRIQPAQRGIGGFLLAQLIEWAQRHYGAYAVTPILLQDDDATSEETRQIRSKLLSAAGFEITQSEDQSGVEHARAGQVEQLISQWKSERIGVLHVAGLLRQLRELESANHRQAVQGAQLQRTVDQYQSNDTGQRFAIGCLISFAVFQALMLLWIVLS